MSDWGTQITAIMTLIRTAVDTVGTMPSGDLGAERDVRDGFRLNAGQLPHLFVFNPQATDTELEFQQTETVTTIQAELWDDATQETMSLYRDAIRAAVVADPTLGSTVQRFRMPSSGVVEDSSGSARKVLLVEFQTTVLES